jgi:hypothetical protein
VAPVIEVNGARLALPFTIEPDQMVELWPDGRCLLYGKNNYEKQRVDLGPRLPIINSGENAIRLSAKDPMPFAYLTPILRSQKIMR